MFRPYRWLNTLIALWSLWIAVGLDPIRSEDPPSDPPSQYDDPPSKVDTESLARLRNDIEFLASDEMQGRGVQTEGLKRAGDFIATRWQDLGFKVDSFDGKPFQDFGINGPMEVGDPNKNLLELEGPNGEQISLGLGIEFTPVSLGTNGVFDAPLVFAGYGISAKDDSISLHYDDFEGIDVKGKIVIVLRKEPQQNDPKSLFSGTDPSDYSFYSAKEANASLHGAAALILVNDSQTLSNTKPWNTDERSALINELETIATIRKKMEGASSDVGEQSRLIEELNRCIGKIREQLDQLQGGTDLLPKVDGAGRAFGRRRVPTFFAKRALIDGIVTQATGRSLDQFEKEVDVDLKPRSQILDGWKAKGGVDLRESKIPVRNVLAVLPGAGDLQEEYVVVGAHYDHVGMGGAGSLAPGMIAVHNGADDNGSGTVSLLEVSKRLSDALPKIESRRTVVFIAFTAEELGLLGSAHYVRNPKFSLEKTVAMVNMDMVGRLASNTLTVYGTGTAKEFDELIETTNQRYHFNLDKSPEGMGPSDHASFFEKKIPVFHFFTGLHKDYHRPSDDFDKINVTGMVRITDMVTDVVTHLVTQQERPSFIPIRGSANPRQQRAEKP